MAAYSTKKKVLTKEAFRRRPDRAFPIHPMMRVLKKQCARWVTPAVTRISEHEDPFEVLISTILSLRTQDKVTLETSQRLFAVGKTPSEILGLGKNKIAKLIYPSAFYRTKSGRIEEICRILIEKYQGRVPSTLEELLELKGVGRKTANLVITLGFGKPGICVDTHVHRISNRWGYVKTRTPEQTEMALRKILPPQYWIPYNDFLVAFGQNLCRPVSPFCSTCPLSAYCPRDGVKTSR